MINRCLNCGEHPGVSAYKTIRNFCNEACEQAWEKAHVERGDSVGFGGHNLLPIYEIKDRQSLLTRALTGDKEAKRELRRRYRLIKIYDPTKKQEVRL